MDTLPPSVIDKARKRLADAGLANPTRAALLCSLPPHLHPLIFQDRLYNQELLAIQDACASDRDRVRDAVIQCGGDFSPPGMRSAVFLGVFGPRTPLNGEFCRRTAQTRLAALGSDLEPLARIFATAGPDGTTRQEAFRLLFSSEIGRVPTAEFLRTVILPAMGPMDAAGPRDQRAIARFVEAAEWTIRKGPEALMSGPDTAFSRGVEGMAALPARTRRYQEPITIVGPDGVYLAAILDRIEGAVMRPEMREASPLLYTLMERIDSGSFGDWRYQHRAADTQLDGISGAMEAEWRRERAPDFDADGRVNGPGNAWTYSVHGRRYHVMLLDDPLRLLNAGRCPEPTDMDWSLEDGSQDALLSLACDAHRRCLFTVDEEGRTVARANLALARLPEDSPQTHGLLLAGCFGSQDHRWALAVAAGRVAHDLGAPLSTEEIGPLLGMPTNVQVAASISPGGMDLGEIGNRRFKEFSTRRYLTQPPADLPERGPIGQWDFERLRAGCVTAEARMAVLCNQDEWRQSPEGRKACHLAVDLADRGALQAPDAAAFLDCFALRRGILDGDSAKVRELREKLGSTAFEAWCEGVDGLQGKGFSVRTLRYPPAVAHHLEADFSRHKRLQAAVLGDPSAVLITNTSFVTADGAVSTMPRNPVAAATIQEHPESGRVLMLEAGPFRGSQDSGRAIILGACDLADKIGARLSIDQEMALWADVPGEYSHGPTTLCRKHYMSHFSRCFPTHSLRAVFAIDSPTTGQIQAAFDAGNRGAPLQDVMRQARAGTGPAQSEWSVTGALHGEGGEPEPVAEAR